MERVATVHKWLTARTLFFVFLVGAIAYAAWRLATGRSLTGPGHATPADAISYGWAVSPAGITGWLEVSPDGTQRIMHDTGYTLDPYGPTV